MRCNNYLSGGKLDDMVNKQEKVVEVLKTLSPKAREQLKEFKEKVGNDVKPALKSFANNNLAVLSKDSYHPWDIKEDIGKNALATATATRDVIATDKGIITPDVEKELQDANKKLKDMGITNVLLDPQEILVNMNQGVAALDKKIKTKTL